MAYGKARNMTARFPWSRTIVPQDRGKLQQHQEKQYITFTRKSMLQ